MPRPTLTEAQVSDWMLEFAKDPPTPEGLVTDFDLRNLRCDPELALAIRDDGTPEWWPNWHPEFGERKLTPDERHRWFMEVMTDALRSSAETLFTADVALRRRIIARSLIELQADFDVDFPPPDFIEPRPSLSGIPKNRTDSD